MHGMASRRRFVLGLAALSTTALAAACGKATPITPAPAATSAAKPADSAAAKPAAEPTKPAAAADAKPAADSAKPTAAAAAPAASGNRTKIRLVMSNSQDAVKRWLEPMTKVFEDKNPTIQLEHITTPTTDESTQKILAMFAANDPGEVLNLPATRDYKRVAVRKVLLDLEPYYKKDNFDPNVFACSTPT